MENDPVKILLIEDNPGDVRLLQVSLSESKDIQYHLVNTDYLAKGIELALNEDFNIILVDLGLPDSQGLATFNSLHLAVPDIPVVILSGLSDESIALEAVKSGAQDYLIKGSVDSKLLVLAIRYAIERNKLKTSEMAKNAALRSAELKSQFLANMSHEIRTPMYGILGILELLLEMPLTAEQREYAEIIHLSAKSLLEILNEILDISSIEAGKLKLNSENFNLKTILEDTLKLFTLKAQHKKLKLVLDLDPSVSTNVRGDWLRIKQILCNLISNAIKFTENGEITLRVTQKSSTDFFEIMHFEIHDTGIGISAENQAHLFQAFCQLDHSEQKNYGGTGLGLAISKYLVEMMRGKIGVDSEPQKGSTFWFEVPLEKAISDKEHLAIENVAPSNNFSKIEQKQVNILVAEDNPINQKVIVIQLENLGFKPKLARNGEEVLQLLGSEHFDILFLDCQMPLKDGYTTAREIRLKEKKSQERLIIIAMTAYAMESDRQKCIDAGMDDYLSKPIQSKDLQAILCKHLFHNNDNSTEKKLDKKLSGYNFERLSKLVGNNKEELFDLFSLHQKHTHEELDKLFKHIEKMEFQEANLIAHKLAGSSGTFGCITLEQLFRKLMKSTQEENSEGSTKLCQEIKTEINNVEEAFRLYTKTL